MFVCDNRSEDYDIAENIVLKQLLSVIHTTLREAEEYLRGEYDWVQETWKDNQDLIGDLQRIVERNVHIRRIREPDTYEPTERMLTTAANSRQAIYREAASLIRTRNRLFAGDKTELKTLLDETAITPDDDHALFELFVLFRFVSTIERMQNESFQFKTISSGRQEVARLSGEKELVLYHDTAATDRDLSFRADVPTTDARRLSRTEEVQSVAREVATTFFSNQKFHNHTGRPDVIVLEIIDDDVGSYEYLIAEVKNSTRTDTIRQGIKETMEYLAFLRVNENFVFPTEPEEGYFGDGWNGLLVVQDLEQETAGLEEQGDNEINILQASELATDLETVLERML